MENITVSCRYAYKSASGFIDYRLKGSTTNNVIVPTMNMDAQPFTDPSDVSVYSIINSTPTAGVRNQYFVTQTVEQIQALIEG